MAREFAPIKLSIWADDDFRALSKDAQHLYFVLLTSKTLSHCGVVDWRPVRIAALAFGWTVDQVIAAAWELANRFYLVVDESTEEALLRSFVRNDGLMKQPKMAVAMGRAHDVIASGPIRGVVVHELRRLHDDYPELNGWKAEKAIEILSLNSIDPSTYPTGYGMENAKERGRDTGPERVNGDLSKGVPNSLLLSPDSLLLAPGSSATSDIEPAKTSSPQAAKPADPSGFDEFWQTYPRRQGRGDAVKAFAKAIKRADIDEILAAAHRYAVDPNRVDQFTAMAATWLNQDRWLDDALPGRAPERSGSMSASEKVSGWGEIAQMAVDPNQAQIGA